MGRPHNAFLISALIDRRNGSGSPDSMASQLVPGIEMPAITPDLLPEFPLCRHRQPHDISYRKGDRTNESKLVITKVTSYVCAMSSLS